MGFSEERQKCYEWFAKEYGGKIGVVAFESAFKEVALKAWCARAAQNAAELAATTANTGSPKLLATLDNALGNINGGRWSVAEALLRNLRQQLRAGA